MLRRVFTQSGSGAAEQRSFGWRRKIRPLDPLNPLHDYDTDSQTRAPVPKQGRTTEMRRPSAAPENAIAGKCFGACSRRTLLATTGAVAAAMAVSPSRSLAESPTPTELWSGEYTATKQTAAGPV